MRRVVPRIRLSSGKLLSLEEISRAKEAAITRTSKCLRNWIERGVVARGVIVHMPHTRIGKCYYSSLPGLAAFLDALQDISHATTASLADKFGPPVVSLKGDVFEKRGK